MNDTATELSPQQQYNQRYAELVALRIAAQHAQDEAQIDALGWALKLLERTTYDVRKAQEHHGTRYFCGLCYREIERGKEVATTRQRGYYHRACSHLVDGSEPMPSVRKQLERGTYTHDDCWTHRSYHDCPVLDGGQPIPTIGEKRTVFAEPR